MRKSVRTLLVGNERGVHGRVATALAEIALRHQVRLVIVGADGTERADCASILDVLALALVQGTAVRIEAEGMLADKALEAVEYLLTAKDDPQ